MFKTSTQKINNNKTVIYLYDHNEIAKCQIPPYIVKLTPFLLGHRVAFFKVQSVLIPQDILTTTLLFLSSSYRYRTVLCSSVPL